MSAPQVRGRIMRSWVVSNGNVGSETQCFGIADALGLAHCTKRVAPKAPWRWLAPFGPPAPDKTIRPPWPTILIASGRQTIPYARSIRKAAKGACFTIVLQNPRVSPKHFDLVWIPEHDRLRGKNVISTLTSPHRITDIRLAEAAEEHKAAVAHLPRPRLAVLLGGPNAVFPFGADDETRLTEALATLARDGTGLMITASRRTPASLIHKLRARLDADTFLLWDDTNAPPNPYMGFLALADSILATADSVSMVGEACATGKPVYVFPLAGGSAKFTRFTDALKRARAVRVFDGRLENWDAVRLNATETIARRIRETMDAQPA